MIDELRLGWAALRESPQTEGAAVMVRRLAVDIPAGPLLLGWDGLGRSHLLIGAPGPGPEDDRVEAVRVGRRTLVIDSKPCQFVDVVLEAAPLAEVFDHFAVAVIDAVRQRPDEHPAAVAIEILDRWRRFLALGSGPLGPERLAPIFAEMSVLADIARFGTGAVHAWRGPGARHDFVRGNCAVEVKSTLAHTSREITAHGVDQLEPPAGGRLFLDFVRLEEAIGDGRSVPDLVDRVLGLGVPPSALYAAVERSGLTPADYDEARKTRFRIRERSLLPVVEPFPRIIPGSFVQGEQPPGIRDVIYRSDLDTVIASRLTPKEAEAVYRELGTVM